MQANESRCMFSALEVDNKDEEVGGYKCCTDLVFSCCSLFTLAIASQDFTVTV